MPYTVAITSQGQISIPAKVRRAAGIQKGGRAVLTYDKGKIVVEPVKDFLELKGSIKTTKPPLSNTELHEAFGKYLAEEAVGKAIPSSSS